jgi:hypothetical protein
MTKKPGPKHLSPRAVAEIQAILDQEARRMMEEALKAEKPQPHPKP